MLKRLTLPLVAALVLAGNAFAADQTGTFEKKSFKIKGSWTLTEVDGQQVIRFNDDFKTKNGPDLKLFLSKKTVDNLSKSPTFDAPLSLGLLDSNKGQQEFVLPEGVNLDDYESILIHCEQYNKLWGGFDIPEDDAAEEVSYGS
ncbi:MAG: DM13 domain-containing protein [Maricaulaceae bacterium]